MDCGGLRALSWPDSYNPAMIRRLAIDPDVRYWQVAARAVREIRSDKPVRCALITSGAEFIEIARE
jgi:hypothetical protein